MSEKKKSQFESIAIVGRGCVLPSCHSVDELWKIVEGGKVETSSASKDDWHVNQQRLLSDNAGVYELDKMWSNHGGYVRGFDDIFDASQFQLNKDLLDTLDPVFLWSLEAARQAMTEVKSKTKLDNAGVILGNLSYPTRAHSKFAEEVWLKDMRGEGQVKTAAENRFMSGLPANIVAKGMGFGGSTLALDAACASGLYAIKIACDRLQSGQADIMLAGAVNAADPLFIHMGFCALNALSKTGTSQPFSQDADGLVPSEGAAFVALKRLVDARADGDKIYGVIQGLGLSNDGRSGGFLSPSTDGQVDCINKAYEMSSIQPDQVQFVECHATGTEAGDSTEIESLGTIFPNAVDLPLGSLKGNLGHLITASGVAGLLKIILAFENKTIPGTPNATPNLASIKKNGFIIPAENTNWESTGPRIAAISSFGFGGNNAHLIVQEESADIETAYVKPDTTQFAIVNLALRTDQDSDADAFGKRICSEDLGSGNQGSGNQGLCEQISLSAKSLAFPPNDLKEALGQQLILLDLLPQIEHSINKIDHHRMGIFIGMQTDSEVCRYGLRWRLEDLDPSAKNIDLDKEIASSPNASSVIGKMPNVPANRLSNQLDIKGPGFTVSREELSGDGALELAMTAIHKGELDAAIVGAVELGNENVHQYAINKLNLNPQPSSDAAILLVIKNLEQAKIDGDDILALISTGDESKSQATSQNNTFTQGAHSAAGLLNISAGIQKIRAGQSQKNGINHSPIVVTNHSIFGETTVWNLEPAGSSKAYAAKDSPLLEFYAAQDRVTLVQNLEKGLQSELGHCRIAIVSKEGNFEKLRQRAVKGINSSKLAFWSLDGISFSEAAIKGEIASVFTGAASSYPEMGSDLFLALPDISRKLAKEMPGSAEAMKIAFDSKNDGNSLPSIQLAGSSYLSQLHARITQDMLKIKSDVAMGLSSGETNSMFAFKVWQDMDSLQADIDNTELYRSALAEDFTAIRQAWNLEEGTKINWVNYIVLAPTEDVKKAINTQDRAYLTIVQSNRDAVIGGDSESIDAVLKHLGNPETIPLGHDLAVHCAVVEPFEPIWRALHTRKTSAPKGVRFYSNYLGGSYKVNRKNVADALTGQALNTVDFPKIVEAAYQDDVRIFIEHGPRNSLTNALDVILGDRPHLAVALDNPAIPAMTQLYRTVASLWAAGINIDISEIERNIVQNQLPTEPSISFNLRLPAITVQEDMQIEKDDTYCAPDLNAGPESGRLMPKAPVLAFTITPSKKPQSKPRALPIPIRATASVSKVLNPISKQNASTKNNFVKNNFVKVAATQETSVDVIKTAPVITPIAVPNQAVGEHQLLVQGHQRMLEAHQSFLATQMQGQAAFESTMSRMQSILMDGSQGAVSVTHPVQPLATTAPINRPQLAVDPVIPTKELAKNTLTQLKEPRSKVPDKRKLPGPSFTREQLEVLSSGQISSVMGAIFEQQDDYLIQVRMPEPPLLLCDRVLGIEGEAGSMGTGTIWTETDVKTDSWYLHNGRMPPGIFIESGQADLLLISWLGIDFHNKGDRAYRLLGCELIFHGELPKPGETLEYEIKVDGHAKQGDVRLFFFHYDCHINGELRISVRNGQAGFFTKQELADSAGVLWEAETGEYSADFKKVDADANTLKTKFNRADMAAYLAGDLQACFGDEFSWAHTHTRTPGSPEGQGNFLGEVTHFEPEGGPKGRGYLRIVEEIHADDWFFNGHFNNDPCMPGTLMADACLQAMAFYMSARGRTLHKDGWRFQPVRDTNYKFVCRGQALPESGTLVYEIFVDEEIVDKEPQLFAHVMCTIDGRKAFLCERLGLQLVPDWPLGSMPELLAPIEDERPLAYINEFPLDYHSLISCAWGKPSTAFGQGFAHYDGPLRSPRLPGPPYHFMTRIVSLEGEMASMKKGGRVEALYDIREDAWFFDDNASNTMPFCVLMEIALQPCGWLASYTLGRDYANSDLLFRNLDGTGTQHREIVPGDHTLKTTATMTSLSQIGELIIENFDVVCTINDEPVYTMKTVFGFFPPEAMENQKGLTITDTERVIFDQASNELIDLTDKPNLYFDHPSAHLPNSKLLMVDRITYLDREGGDAGIGSIRGEKDVNIREWFFKAHFFQDPVQPGSLGIEAMIQVMQTLMLSQGLHERFETPRFEPIMIEAETEWHYRGQITPTKTMISVDFQCQECVIEEDNTWIMGDARLWGDGLKIYHAPRIGLRLVEDTANLETPNRDLVEANWHGVRDYWISQSKQEHFLVHDIGAALIHKFVRNFKVHDPEAFAARRGQPAIYLANHQVGVESFLFLGMIAAMTGIPAEAIAKQEHRDTWLGQISQLTEAELKENSTTRMLFFDREDQSDMLRILNNFAETVHKQPRSLLVHVDGTRAQQAGQPCEKVSSVLIDMAIKYQIPIVPVRFAGGLPLSQSDARLEFPVNYGSQDFYVGAALSPSDLEALPYVERAKKVISLINDTGPKGPADGPNSADREFMKLVQSKLKNSEEISAVIRSALETLPSLGLRMQNLLTKLEAGELESLNNNEKIVAALLK
ncbi:MAG: acyl transferase domain-containing protein/3-hydroxymyristoyl [Flavobacterium sp.]